MMKMEPRKSQFYQEPGSSFSEISEKSFLEKSSLSVKDHLVSATIWVPLACVAGLFIAIANVIVSYISKYGFKARYLQAPGGIIAYIMLLVRESYYDKYGTSTEPAENPQERSYFTWYYDIMYYKPNTKGNPSDEYKLHWTRIKVLVILGGIGLLNRFAFIESYYFATLAEMNTGILMSIYCTKAIISSILFYFFFKQALKWFEIVGIALCIGCAILLSISVKDPVNEEDAENPTHNGMLAIILMFISLGILSMRSVIIKKFFAYNNNNVNISALAAFRGIIFDIGFFVVFIIELFYGFKVTNMDILMGICSGFLTSIVYTVIAFVNAKGKAGPADALVETSVIYQTILDALIFERYPNMLQIGGLAIGIAAIILILSQTHKS